MHLPVDMPVASGQDEYVNDKVNNMCHDFSEQYRPIAVSVVAYPVPAVVFSSG